MLKQSYLMVDAIAQRENFFTKIDSRIKVVVCILTLAAVVGLPGYRLPLAVFTLAGLSLCWIKTPGRLVAARLVPPLALGTMVLVVMVFVKGGHPLVSIHFASFNLVGYREGLIMGVTVFSRIMASVTMLFFLGVTTPMQELGFALLWCRVPKVIVEILLLTYRYIFVLWDEGMRIREAQTLRLGYPSLGTLDGWKMTIKSTTTLMAMVFIRAYDRAESTFSAMQVRAYNGNIVSTGYAKWSRLQTSQLISGVLILFVLIAVSLLGGQS